MDNKRWALYILILVIGEYLVIRQIDQTKHMNPNELVLGTFPQESLYLLPLLAVILIHIIIEFLPGYKQVEKTSTPLAYVFLDSPSSQWQFAHYNPLTFVGARFLFIVNASRKFKQKHRGQRIIAIIPYNRKEKDRFEAKAEFPYIYDDILSHEEIIQYVRKEGAVVVDDRQLRRYLTDYPQLLTVGDIRTLEVQGLPSTMEQTLTAMVLSGQTQPATQLAGARFGGGAPETKRG